ncbi:hypothetical protein QTP88_000654 [Uroleucon formosanum]
MMIFAYDKLGIIVTDRVPIGSSVTGDYYKTFLAKKLRPEIRKKRPGMLQNGVSILHDNARPHIGAPVVALLEKYGWERLKHPPYSPDLSPPDFDLFPKLKEPLRGIRFPNLDILNEEVSRRIRELNKDGVLCGIQALPKRWQSCIDKQGDYIEVEVRSAIVALMADQSYFTKKMAKKLEFMEDDWEKCSNLIVLLKPLELATSVLCADKKATISIVRPIISSLLSNKFKINTSDNELTVKFKSIVSNELSERFGFGIHNDNILIGKPKVSVFACLLDPRHKNLNHETSENVKEHIRHTVKSLIQSYEETSYENDHGQINKNTTAMDILLGEADISYNEFEQYISEIQINHNLDPCMWWKEHETIYPTIAKVAKNILCIPASSASSERVFSTAGNIVTSKRNRLNAKNVSTLVFLKQNNNI